MENLNLDNRTFPDYSRHCSFYKPVDGDTVEVMVDLGFRRYSRERIRIKGIDAPENEGETKVAGDAATEFTTQWFLNVIDGQHFILDSHKADSFGRWLGTIYKVDKNGEIIDSLADALLASGNAIVYKRKTK